MLTGTLGMALLYYSRKSFRNTDSLSAVQWIPVFMSLFWLRQISNTFTWFLFYFINGRFGLRGDEIKLALFLGLPKWSVLCTTALAGIIMVSVVIFQFIPKKIRVTFLISGLLGGVLGHLFWLDLFGKILMP